MCGAGRELRSIDNGEQNISSRLMDSVGCARQEVWQFGVEGGGVGVLCLGVQIEFRGDVWRTGCHGGMLIVGHEASNRFLSAFH